MSEKKDQLENIQQKQDPNYWRSFEELYANKEFINEKLAPIITIKVRLFHITKSLKK
jgi:hypothetical protein